jgi:hypothetical protein
VYVDDELREVHDGRRRRDDQCRRDHRGAGDLGRHERDRCSDHRRVDERPGTSDCHRCR